MNEIKSFRDQFIECSNNGFHGKGEFLNFEKHPENLPAFPNKKMREAIKDGSFNGIQTIACLKFSGRCSSVNTDCRKLRGYKIFKF